MKYLYILANSPHLMAVIAESEFELERLLLFTGKYDWDECRKRILNSAIKIPLNHPLEDEIIGDKYWSFLRRME